MIRVWQAVVFFFVFSLDISVQAKVLNLKTAKNIKQHPEECLLNSEVCSIRTSRGVKYKMKLVSAHITLSEESALKRVSGSEVIFLEGAAWIRGLGNLTIKTPQGSIRSQKGDEFIITKMNKNYVVDVLSGSVTIQLVGFEKIAKINEGTSNKIFPVSEKGHAEVGLPVAFDYFKVLENLASLWDADRSSFAKKVTQLKTIYSKTLKDIALLHKKEAVRAIASYREEKLRKEKEEQERIKEEQFLKRLYRQKVFGIE